MSCVAGVDGELARGLPDVDPVIGVGGVAEDPLVFLVEGVHRMPGERDRSRRIRRNAGSCRVFPRAARTSRDTVTLTAYQAVAPELAMLGHAIGRHQDLGRDVALGKYATG